MLSIIVSSYQKDYFNQFSSSVKETIGKDFEYEIIQIWNPDTMGICDAYNKGAEQSKYEYLLFVHEDVIFETKNWGVILLCYLKNEKIGCVGIAGSNYVPNCPASWHIDQKYMFRNLIQSSKENKKLEVKKSEKKQVYSLDGVFIGIAKEKYKSFKFNQDLKGFHGYDIDFSIRVSEKYKNYVIPDISLIHYSKGGFSKDLVKSRIIARKNYNIPNTQVNDMIVENKALHIYLSDMIKSNFTRKEIVINFLPYLNPKKIGIKNIFYNLKKISLLK